MINNVRSTVDIAMDTIDDLETHAKILEPEMNSAGETVQQLRGQVEQHRQKYMEV